MTQTAVAQKARVDQSTISALEHGRWAVEEATLARIADALSVPLLWLRDGQGQGPRVSAETPSEPPTGTGAGSGVRRVNAPSIVLDEAIEAAFDKTRGHRLADIDAVREAFAAVPVTGTVASEELINAARRLLDAAATLRTEGQPVSLASITLKVAGIA